MQQRGNAKLPVVNLKPPTPSATTTLLSSRHRHGHCLPLRESRLTDADRAKVQRRRELPTRIMQAGQVFLQNAAIRE